MEIITTNANWQDSGRLISYSLDLAYGDDENDFELSVPENTILERGSVWYMDGTEFGGIIDTVASVQERGTAKRTYKGRSFQGILADKVILPPSNVDYYSFDADANELLGEMISYLSLGAAFAASTDESIHITGRFDRYTDFYSGIRKAFRANGLRLGMKWKNGRCLLWAESSDRYDSAIDSDLVRFDIERRYRPINHLVCLGAGQLRNRLVRHVYADESGNVSTVQSMFGVDELAEVYDYNNIEDATELIEKGTEKLQDYQGMGEVELSIAPVVEFFIDDEVVAQDMDFGITVEARVTKKIVKANGGTTRIEYECGTPEEADNGY